MVPKSEMTLKSALAPPVISRAHGRAARCEDHAFSHGKGPVRSKARLSWTPRSGELAASGNEAKIERFGYGLGAFKATIGARGTPASRFAVRKRWFTVSRS